MDKFVEKDANAPPAPNNHASDADLPPLKYTSLALFRTWAQILFGVSQVTGSHCWFRSALGCILGVTVFSPYVKTVVEYCIDRILSVFSQPLERRWNLCWSWRQKTNRIAHLQSICLHKTDKSKTHTFTFGGNKKLELDRPNLFLAKYENLLRDWI